MANKLLYGHSEKKISYDTMFELCKFLYHKSNASILSNENIQNQAKVQFHREFDAFYKELSQEDDMSYFTYDRHTIVSILKMFILFKAIKMNMNMNVLDDESLPDDKERAIELANILSIDNISSIGGLDGTLNSVNNIYIKKLYALIWANFNIPTNEIYIIMDYIICLEQNVQNINKFIDKILKKLYLNEENVKNFDFKIFRNICNDKMNNIFKEPYKFFIRNEQKISIFSYYILKLFIYDKWKKCKQQLLTIKILKNRKNINIINKITAPQKELEKIYEITKNIYTTLDNDDEFVNQFKRNKKVLSNNNQNIVLKFILQGYPDTKKNKLGRTKDEERTIIKRNYLKIYLLYKQYLQRSGINIKNLTTFPLYKMIIAGYLFFYLKELDISDLKQRNFSESKSSIPFRAKSIASILHTYISNGSSNEKDIITGYLSIINGIFSFYDSLFDRKVRFNFNATQNNIAYMGHDNMFYNVLQDMKKVEIHNDFLDRFWHKGLQSAYNLVFVGKTSVPSEILDAFILEKKIIRSNIYRQQFNVNHLWIAHYRDKLKL